MIDRLVRRRPRPAHAAAIADPARVTRILAIKVHDQLGDFLVATPALRALRTRYPGARLALVTRAMIAPLARHDPDLDRVWVMPRVRGPAEASAFAGVLGGIAGFRPDLAFVLNSVSRSRTADSLARLSGARLVVGRSRVYSGPLPADAPERPFESALDHVGRSRDRVYDLDLEPSRASEHQVDRYLDLVRWTGASTDRDVPVLELTAAERSTGRESLATLDGSRSMGRPWVGLHAGTGDARKCWPLDRFVALGARLASEGAALWVFDTPKEPGRAQQVVAGLAARGVPAALVPAGPVDRFAAQCSALDLLVCNDSGVLHIASALEVATLSFHSLGRPVEWAPRRATAIALYAPGSAEAIPYEAAEAAALPLLGRRATPRDASQYM